MGALVPSLTQMSLLAFCQVTRELPNDIQILIWELSRETPFEEWFRTINEILINTHGVEVGDLPDHPFIDYHEEGLEPQDVVDIMLEDIF